jgi:hypothetical protein
LFQALSSAHDINLTRPLNSCEPYTFKTFFSLSGEEQKKLQKFVAKIPENIFLFGEKVRSIVEVALAAFSTLLSKRK